MIGYTALQAYIRAAPPNFDNFLWLEHIFYDIARNYIIICFTFARPLPILVPNLLV